jgi:hypothetical protein
MSPHFPIRSPAQSFQVLVWMMLAASPQGSAEARIWRRAKAGKERGGDGVRFVLLYGRPKSKK